jgi:hypothetical protein
LVSDFIKHLFLAPGDSNKLHGSSLWISGEDAKFVQMRVNRDRTTCGDASFGYAFESLLRPSTIRARRPIGISICSILWFHRPASENADRQPELHRFRHGETAPGTDLGPQARSREPAATSAIHSADPEGLRQIVHSPFRTRRRSRRKDDAGAYQSDGFDRAEVSISTDVVAGIATPSRARSSCVQ